MNFSGLQVLKFMLLHMLIKISFLSKSFWAVGSLVRPIPHMHADVIFEVPLLVELSPAPRMQTHYFLDQSTSAGVGNILIFMRVEFHKVLVLLPDILGRIFDVLERSI